MNVKIRVFAAAALLLGGLNVHAAAKTVRPEVGAPLQQAQTLLQAKNYRAALEQVAAADKIDGLTAYERYIIERLRAAAAGGAGNYPVAIKAYETALASPEFPQAERVQTLEAVARLAYSAKTYGSAAQAIRKYRDEGGRNADTLALLPQALYLAEDFPGAGRELSAQIAAIEKAGSKPTEAQLQLLASIALKQSSEADYAAALEKLVTYHPNDRYWLDLILRTAKRAGFSQQLTLDVYRLRFETGTLSDATDYIEAAQLALQAGLPGEARQFLETGYQQKLLGTGAQADIDRHKRLADLIARKVEEDRASLAEGERAAAQQVGGDALVASGLNYVGYGDYDRGIALIEQGIAKGKLRHPELVNLHLGYAYLRAGRKNDAFKTLQALQSSGDGVGDLGRLWLVQARSA